jgi:predicted O-methyltransferase YrrM
MESNRVYRFNEDAEFQELLTRVTGISLVDPVRLYVLYQLAKQFELGYVAEVGVYTGGSALILLKGHNGNVDLFDTFEGMPPTDILIDYHKEGEFKASLQEVEAFLSDFHDFHIYPGLFPESTGQMSEFDRTKLYSLVHVDVDIFQSAKDCLEYFYPRMVKGGVIVFDDYSFRSTPGVKVAIDEFLVDKPEKIIDINTGQGLLIKM